MKKIIFTWPNGLTITATVLHSRFHKAMGQMKTVVECLVTKTKYIIYGAIAPGWCDYKCANILAIE
jgi:hypothetical protein